MIIVYLIAMESNRIPLNLERLQELVDVPSIFVEKKKRHHITKTMRTRILNRDHNHCVICFRENRLRIHHIKPYGLSTLNNLVTLCFICHEYVHKLLRFKGYPYYVPTIPLRNVKLR